MASQTKNSACQAWDKAEKLSWLQNAKAFNVIVFSFTKYVASLVTTIYQASYWSCFLRSGNEFEQSSYLHWLTLRTLDTHPHAGGCDYTQLRRVNWTWREHILVLLPSAQVSVLQAFFFNSFLNAQEVAKNNRVPCTLHPASPNGDVLYSYSSISRPGNCH